MKRINKKLPLKLVIIALIVILSGLSVWNYLVRFLQTSDFFKVKEVILNLDKEIDLSYLRGENIFQIDLIKESNYLSEHYPNYRNISLMRVLPNRLFINFVERRPIGIVKLHRYFYVDNEGALFGLDGDFLNTDLPLILGLETKIFGPRSGRKYSVKELTVALNIIKEINQRRPLKYYKIKRIDVASLSDISCFLLATWAVSINPKVVIGLEIKLSEEGIKDKINILSALVSQIKNDLPNIKYIDLRFKEPVVKLKDK